MMALVVCIVLALLFSISSREIVSNVENTLEASVFGAFEDMEYEDGRWDFDSDLMNLEDGVYLSVYDKNSQELLYGRIPYGFAYDLPLKREPADDYRRGKTTTPFWIWNIRSTAGRY